MTLIFVVMILLHVLRGQCEAEETTTRSDSLLHAFEGCVISDHDVMRIPSHGGARSHCRSRQAAECHLAPHGEGRCIVSGRVHTDMRRCIAGRLQPAWAKMRLADVRRMCTSVLVSALSELTDRACDPWMLLPVLGEIQNFELTRMRWCISPTHVRVMRHPELLRHPRTCLRREPFPATACRSTLPEPHHAFVNQLIFCGACD